MIEPQNNHLHIFSKFELPRLLRVLRNVSATTMESAVLEVLSVQTIAETVFSSSAIEIRRRAGTHGGPVRITWAALVEKGIAVGVLEEKEA